MIHDLAPYMRPVLEGVLENSRSKRMMMARLEKASFFVKLARAMLDGYESLFFVNGKS